MAMTKTDKIKMLLLFLVWFLVFFPIMPEMFHEWSGTDNQHGFLVPIIALYLVWQREEDLLPSNLGSSLLGAIVLVSSVIAYLLCYVGGVAFPARVAMVLSLFGLIWYCLGDKWMRVLRFPVLFLLFMIPVPYSLMNMVSVPLQLMATKLSANLIQFCSIPVVREGNMLFFVTTQLEVAEACSGIRSIMSLVMLATIFAYLSPTNWQRKTILVLSAIPIAMVANIIRITGTGILANFFGDQVAKGFLHEFSGMVVFVFGLITLGLLNSLLNRKSA
jgi:exosortase